MIGDRARDIMAGKTNGLKTIAVTYGYGNPGEFHDPEPDAVCQTPNEITASIARLALLS
jgi:phosphoglycolate phosphatase